MVKSIFVSLFLMLAVSISAQTKRYYCEVKGVENEVSTGLKIVFDFGNKPVYAAFGGLRSNQKLVNEKGEEIPFYSMVDAGNYLSDKGWTFVQAYTSVYDSQAIVHWIFIKEAESKEEAIKGIMTKEEYNKNKNH